MLGYGKDSHSYRVFNIFHYKMVETVDARFVETNRSQREHLPNVLDEVHPSESIKQMGIGEIIPSEAQIEAELIIYAPNQPEYELSLKTILKIMTLISKSRIVVLFILVLQMKYRLRR